MNLIHRILNAAVLSLALAGAAHAAQPPAPVAAAAAARVNINTADAAALDRVLLNVGPAKAKAIVDYRTANGPFRSIDQLALVKGIGLKTIERNRDRILAPIGVPVGAAGSRAAAPRLPSRASASQR